jgi:hypothetical protein
MVVGVDKSIRLIQPDLIEHRTRKQAAFERSVRKETAKADQTLKRELRQRTIDFREQTAKRQQETAEMECRCGQASLRTKMAESQRAKKLNRPVAGPTAEEEEALAGLKRFDDDMWAVAQHRRRAEPQEFLADAMPMTAMDRLSQSKFTL